MILCSALVLQCTNTTQTTKTSQRRLQTKPRESWEEAHDYYYDQLGAEGYEGLDDLEEWKEEEQRIIDELRERLYGTLEKA